SLTHTAAELDLVPVRRRDGNGNDGVGGHDLSERRAQGDAFDCAFEQTCKVPGGLQRRRHLLTLVDREKNALHGTSLIVTDEKALRSRQHSTQDALGRRRVATLAERQKRISQLTV